MFFSVFYHKLDGPVKNFRKKSKVPGNRGIVPGGDWGGVPDGGAMAPPVRFWQIR